VLIDPAHVGWRANKLAVGVRHFCHWSHARYLVAHFLGEHGEDGRAVYSALLKWVHLSKPNAVPELVRAQIASVFCADYTLVRTRGVWVAGDDLSTVLNKDGIARAGMLPAGQYVGTDRKGKPALLASKPKQSRLKSNEDLSEIGYSPVEPIPGIDLAGAVGDTLTDRDAVPALVPCKPAFRYRTANERADIWACWDSYFRGQFPGVCIPLVKLVIGAALYAQRGGSEPPRGYISGATKAAKTAHVRLAVEVMGGGELIEVGLSQSDEKFRREFARASRRALTALCDEVAKDDRTPAALQKLLLSITAGSVVHELYVGGVPIGRPAALWFVDTTLCETFREPQIARRTVYAPLGGGIQSDGKRDWRDTIIGGRIEGWRRGGSGVHADICDVIVSEVQDDVRRGWGEYADPDTGERTRVELTTFENYAATLGFQTIDKHADGVDTDAAARSLFAAYLDSPPTTATGRLRGKGWCAFAVGDGSPLAKAWESLAGEDGDVQPFSSRHWWAILGIPGLLPDVNVHRRQIAIRFRVGESRSPLLKVGRDVLPENHELHRSPGSAGNHAEQTAPAVETATTPGGVVVPTPGCARVGNGSGPQSGPPKPLEI
jgi:hypothetical protein